MSPPRKKPICHTCNTPMAGHKRPFGQPMCPDPDEPADHQPKAASPLIETNVVIPIIPRNGFYHYVNPNYVERNPPPPSSHPPERAESPMTCVSTEPADEMPVKREPITYIEQYHRQQTVRIHRSQSVASSVTSTSSSYIRRLQQALTTSVPLASMFKTPRQDITPLTRAARAEGMYTALIQQPRHRNGDGTSGGNPWTVVVGQDAGTVAELADMYERDAVGTLGRNSLPPSTPPSLQSWIARYTVKCMIGGLSLFVCLWAVFMVV
ncbi:hypothetical protein BXZ70DRAFT_945979 [Cristinia sonorae]|uniref:Uncharacterized protein n=1 Tax=Cristinia sonorae TaxID=1940300 RepID=A0A8K0ULE3_9AGAR|nr:hypothetical protein BXZ70DRAFT_945979 [Cristinia sonorae]